MERPSLGVSMCSPAPGAGGALYKIMLYYKAVFYI